MVVHPDPGGGFDAAAGLLSGQGTPRDWQMLGIPLLFGLLFAGGTVAATWLYYQWSARQTERKLLRAPGDCRLEISPEGLRYSDREAETRLPWSAVTRIRAMRRHFCFYLGSVPAYLIPRRAFATPEEAVRFLQAAQEWHARARR